MTSNTLYFLTNDYFSFVMWTDKHFVNISQREFKERAVISNSNSEVLERLLAYYY